MSIARLLTALSVAGTLAATQASAQKADVIHFYTSSSESMAIGVFAKEYNARGGPWVDDPAVGPQAESALALNRIAGGNPPAAMQWPVGAATRELAQQGMLTNLDDLAAAGNWAKNLPPLLLKYITVDGHIVSAPVDVLASTGCSTASKCSRRPAWSPRRPGTSSSNRRRS